MVNTINSKEQDMALGTVNPGSVVTVSRKSVTYGLDLWTADASELGLKVGQWPAKIIVGVADEFHFHHFIYRSLGEHEEVEISGARYMAEDGWALRVYND
jgi:hypothetical protein